MATQMRNQKETVQISKIPIINGSDRVVLYLLIGLGWTLTILFGTWWFLPSHFSQNFAGPFHWIDIAVFILLTYVVWHQIINQLFVWYVSLGIKKTEYLEPQSGLKVAFLTAFVPGKEPYDMLENTLRAMVLNDYPHETWLLDEGDDPFAKNI